MVELCKYTFRQEGEILVLHFSDELVEPREVDGFIKFLDGAFGELAEEKSSQRQLVVDLRKVQHHRPLVAMKLIYPLTTRLAKIRSFVSECVCICPSAQIMSVCEWATYLIQKMCWYKVPVRFLTEDDPGRAEELAQVCSVSGLHRPEVEPQ